MPEETKPAIVIITERELRLQKLRVERAAAETPEQKRREVDLCNGDTQCPAVCITSKATTGKEVVSRYCKLVEGHASDHELYDGRLFPRSGVISEIAAS